LAAQARNLQVAPPEARLKSNAGHGHGEEVFAGANSNASFQKEVQFFEVRLLGDGPGKDRQSGLSPKRT